MKPFLLWPLTFLLLLSAGCRQEPSEWVTPETLPDLQARLSTDTPRVGDPIEVNLRLTAETETTLPPWRNLLHEEIRILEESTPRAAVNDAGHWQKNTRLRIAVYNVTDLTLFSETTAQIHDDPPVDLSLPYIAITVDALTDEDALPSLGNMDLMDFRGPEALRRLRRNLLISLFSGILLLLILLWVADRLRKRPGPPPPPPQWDRIALKEIAELRQSDIWRRGDADASAVALSHILRHYIENRFDIHAPELTTEEFLHEAAARPPWPDEDQKSLEAFFTAVDRIKFAAERPGREALDDLMGAAERFVLVTGTPQPEGTA